MTKQTLNIFRAGTHTAANGTTHTITEDDLRSAAENYSLELHEAPIVVGHPKDNGPAYGWIKGLKVTEDGNVEAEPDQVHDDFREMVEDGRFKKISASWYLPDSPANPSPGSYYLRHVGFLGAQPPAIKGLRDAAFNEADDGIIEFEDPWSEATKASLWRGLRDFFLGKYSKEEVDQVLPAYAIEDMEAAARKAIDDELNTPNYSEGNTMTPEEIKAAQDKLAADQAQLKADQDAVAATQAEFAEKASAARLAENTAFVDAQIAAFKIKPADRDQTIAFMESLADNAADFGEGDNKTSSIDFYKAEVEAREPLVDTGERSPDDGHRDEDGNPAEFAERAVAYREKQLEQGINITATQAVKAVKAGKDQQ